MYFFLRMHSAGLYYFSLKMFTNLEIRTCVRIYNLNEKVVEYIERPCRKDGRGKIPKKILRYNRTRKGEKQDGWNG